MKLITLVVALIFSHLTFSQGYLPGENPGQLDEAVPPHILLPVKLDLKVSENNLKCGINLKLQASELASFLKGKHKGMTFKTSSMGQACFYRSYILDSIVDDNGQISTQVKITYEQKVSPIIRCERACSYCPPENCQITGHRTEKVEAVKLSFNGLRFFSRETIEESEF